MRRILLILLAASFVSAAPAPWGIALNPTAHQCAGYWPGDEYVSYTLPPGWVAYRPTYVTGGSLIATPEGNCTFRNGREEDCCRQIGYDFAGRNIGQKEDGVRSLFNSPASFLPQAILLLTGVALIIVATLIFAVIVFLFLRWRRRRKNSGKTVPAAADYKPQRGIHNDEGGKDSTEDKGDGHPPQPKS